MRRLYLYLQKDDFTADGSSWASSVIDLYDNNSYTNFSTTKSVYGSGLVGNDVWTGVAALGATPIDGSGFAAGGRYIDYTGQIDIVNVIIPDEELVLSGTGSVSITITLYTSDTPTASFPEEWTEHVSTNQYADFNLTDCYRYLKMKIDFSGPQGISVNQASVYARVEIGPPNINPLFARTKAILNKFPSWMDIRESETELITEQNYLSYPDSGTLSYSSTPKSLGGKYINAAFGEWLDELDQKVNELELQKYIDTINPNIMAWCYRSEDAPDHVYSVVGDGVRVGCAVTLQEFYEAESTEHLYWWNELNNTLYTNKEYANLEINQTSYVQELMAVWNYFDEFALLVDIFRLPLETNNNLRLRILDVHKNKPGTSIENFKLAIRRELDLWRIYGSTPDSDFSGATPEILEIPDIEASSEYVDSEGMPTPKFIHFVNWLSFEYPTTWGRFIFDEAIWDVAGENYEGYSVLPNRLDATPTPEAYTQSGVGDANDLLLYRPDAFLNPQDFTARLKVRGKRKINTTESREIRLPFELYGQADRKIYNNPIIYPWFTLEVVRTDSSSTPSSADTYFYSFQIRAKSDVDVNQPTNNSFSEFVFLTEGDRTSPEIYWAKKSDGSYYQDGSSTPITPLNAMRLDQISSVTLKHGKWDVGTQSYINKETSDIFSAWFSNTRVGSFVDFDGVSGTYVKTPDSAAASITGSIDIRVRVSLDDWTPSSPQTILSKFESSQKSYRLRINASGQLSLTLSVDGTNEVEAISSVSTGFTNATSRWIRVTWNSATGVVQFFTDDGRTTYEYTTEPTLWKQLGSDQSISIASIYDSISDIEIGSASMGTSQLLAGNLYHLKVRNGINGSVALSFDPAKDAEYPFEYWTASSTGEVWTLYGNAEYKTFEPYTGATPNSTYAKLVYNTSLYFPTMLGGENSPRAYVIVQSNLTSYTIGKWKSPKIPLTATINGKLPDYSPLSQVIQVPDIPWDNYLESTPNKEIVVELTARSVSNKYGGVTEDSDGNVYFLDETYFSINGNSTWTDGYKKTFAYAGLNNLTFSSNNGALYPVPSYYWEYIEYNQNSTFEGTVGQYGPYINGEPSEEGNFDFVFTRQFIDRNDFSIPNSSDYVITWMGVECIDNNDVILWIDSNTIKPSEVDPNVDIQYPENAIIETLDGGVYNFGSIAVYAKVRPNPAPQWNPHINSGYFYDKNQEYYLYANPASEVFTNEASPSLQYVARQGAPIIITADSTPERQLRQVWFFDQDASPISFSLTGKQTITPATPVSDIYLAYNDVYDVLITNASTGQSLSGVYNSSTNKITIAEYLKPGETYVVSYKVNGSFYADNDSFAGSTPCTTLYFDKLPASLGANQYSVTYETSVLHAATPIPVDLSPLYSTFEEGFVFISFNEYDLSKAEIRISPSSIVANGQDYLMITLRSLDEYGNPKPNQTFNISSSWGTILSPSVVTDRDGFAVTYLQAAETANTFSGQINVTGGTSAQIRFDITPAATPSYFLNALPSAEMLPADGLSKNYVFGSVRDSSYTPVPYAYVNWGRSRSVSDLFLEPPVYVGGNGLVISDASGNFSIGPFSAATPEEPGYWFVSTYSSSASPSGSWDEVGDVVFWFEYPDINYGIENMSGLPQQSIQHATPSRLSLPMFDGPEYPVDLSPSANIVASTPSTKYWLPKKWVPVSWYYLKEVGYWGQIEVGATPNDSYYSNIMNLNRWTIGY